MPSDRTQRRLAAILAGDVAGYSRLMGANEERTVAALRSHRREVIDPKLSEHRGRLVNTAGDSVLAEFPSVLDAVRCAVEVQSAMASRNADVPEDQRIVFRIGINIGDVIFQDGEVYGDGVNVAARLEQIAEPGGVYVSRMVREQVQDKLELEFEDLGPQQVKNIARPVEVFRVIKFMEDRKSNNPRPSAPTLQQTIHYCRTQDDVRIAYALTGQGTPLVCAGSWLTHLEFDWKSSYRSYLVNLAENCTLVRYDMRGNGLSDWEVQDISFEAFVRDLESVVDAAGLERFSLMGYSQGCAVSVAYAALHPERVTRLILYGGYALGQNRRPTTPMEKDQYEASLTMIRLGWGQNIPAFRQLFTSLFIPDSTKEQADEFNELQRLTTTPECAVRIVRANSEIDITGILGQLTVPTLVLHARGDERVPFELGRQMAGGIPGARFIALESRNHILLRQELAYTRFIEEIRRFIRQGEVTQRTD